MIALLLRPASSCTTRSPACLPQQDEGLKARQLSPSSWGNTSPSRGLRAAGGSCRRPLLSCLRWRTTKQQDQGATSATGAPLRCPKPWEQREAARFHRHVLPLLQASRSQRVHLGGCGGARAAVELANISSMPALIHRAPRGPLHIFPKTPPCAYTSDKDAIHPPSIPAWVLWTTGRSALKWGSMQEQPRVTSSHGNGGVRR